MWKRTLAAVLTVGVMGTAASVWSYANESSDAAVAQLMPTAKVSLQKGLAAAESQGQPIAGRYEVAEGHVQLCVYTAKDGKFSEVVVDQNTGKIEKTEAITDGDDLVHAQSEMEATSKSKTSLKAAVDRAELVYAGYRATSVTPALSKGHPIAIVSLVHGTQTRSVAESLE